MSAPGWSEQAEVCAPELGCRGLIMLRCLLLVGVNRLRCLLLVGCRGMIMLRCLLLVGVNRLRCVLLSLDVGE